MNKRIKKKQENKTKPKRKKERSVRRVLKDKRRVLKDERKTEKALQKKERRSKDRAIKSKRRGKRRRDKDIKKIKEMIGVQEHHDHKTPLHKRKHSVRDLADLDVCSHNPFLSHNGQKPHPCPMEQKCYILNKLGIMYRCLYFQAQCVLVGAVLCDIGVEEALAEFSKDAKEHPALRGCRHCYTVSGGALQKIPRNQWTDVVREMVERFLDEGIIFSR